jgi:Ca2+-binding EF-hand superfamily protein
MKKIITLAIFALIAGSAHAEWDLFKNTDHNKDGSVSKEEWIAQRQKAAGEQGKKFNEQQAMKAFKEADTNGDGSLSKEETEALQASWKRK